MAEPNDSHPVRIGIISTVVSAIIIAALAELWNPAKNALIWIWTQLKLLLSLFTTDYSTPGWFLAILGVCSLVAISRLLRSLMSVSVAAPPPSHLQYTSDRFHGALWRWSWNGQNIFNLWCFCPSCDSELIYDESSCNEFIYKSSRKTDFICEHCNQKLVASIPGGNKNYAISAIKREIGRKLRTGEAEKIHS